MPKYCPKCECEILPYLKTNELKRVDIIDKKLVCYQLYWCISCKIVYYVEHEIFDFLNLNLIQETAENAKKRKDRANKTGSKKPSTNS